MTETQLSLPVRQFGRTARLDAWWLMPLVTFLVFSAFIIYTSWAAHQGANYTYGPYLSPLYSPEIFGNSPHAWFGPWPFWWPSFLPFSPAILILWAPGLFRFTCYYYRGAYYKAFKADPVACTVGERKKKYTGERSFPLILQNLHRYFFFIALGIVVLLAIDALKAMWFDNPATGGKSFGIGVGTLVLTTNAVLLGCYTLGCHSFRHLVGGVRDRLSGAPVRNTLYNCASCLNRRHMLYAWTSLFWVGFSDIYVRMCAMGVWTDWRIL